MKCFSPVVVGAMVWRRLDVVGHEASWLRLWTHTIQLSGITTFQFNRDTCNLTYSIACDKSWRTRDAKIGGALGEDGKVALKITVDDAGEWRVNDKLHRDAAGCVDLDLSFSPSTNLLPIRRLGLEVGEEARIRVAWLRFPEFALEPVEQVYRRTGRNTYGFESGGGKFHTTLRVDSNGFVTHYPKLWKVEDGA